MAALVGARAAAAVAHRVRDRLASPQPGELSIEPRKVWVLSGPMATSDATQSGDGAQQGGIAQSVHGFRRASPTGLDPAFTAASPELAWSH